MMRSRVLGLVAIGLLAVACRDSGGDDDDDVFDGGVDGQSGDDVTIFAIQQGEVAVGTPVTVRGVVVTAVDSYGERVGGVYVSEPEGGAYSGVFVYGADLAVASDLVPGDLVDIERGEVVEFSLTADTTGRKLTEISPVEGSTTLTITKVGTGTVPAPTVVDPALFASSDAEAEKWEGVLIQFENVAVTSAPNLDPTKPVDQHWMKITGNVEVSAALTSIEEITAGTCYATFTAIGDYFFQYKVVPRSAADMVTGGTCPVENTLELCSDGLDNDNDTFADCDDWDCREVNPACNVATTIMDVQNGTVPEGTLVTIEGVVVTAAIDDTSVDNRDYVWLQDPAGGEYSGVVVYRPTVTGGTIADLLPGDVVTVEGTVDEYYELTELGFATITETGTQAPLDPAVVTPEALADPLTAEPWEGVLIALENVAVVSANPDAPSDYGNWTIGTASAAILVDNNLGVQRPDPIAVGDCFATVAGVLDYSWSLFRILPRTLDDIVAGGTCP